MASGPHRPGFYLGVLIAGFITGGALTALLRQTMPESAARTFFTTSWDAQFGPVSADLLVISFTLGPIALHVSLLSLIAVVVAYLIARSESVGHPGCDHGERRAPQHAAAAPAGGHRPGDEALRRAEAAFPAVAPVR
jgi:hypothetical protein